MPWTIVITLVLYVVWVKSSGGPIGCQSKGTRLNSGPSAKPSAGSVNAAAATRPLPCVTTFMNRRRVTVSPSNAPGICRSAVYLDLKPSLCRSATCVFAQPQLKDIERAPKRTVNKEAGVTRPRPPGSRSRHRGPL